MIEELRERKQAFEEQLSQQNQRLWDVLLFLTLFTVLAAPLYLLLWQGWNPVWLRELNATVASQLLGLVGLDTAHSGPYLAAEHLTVNVSTDSTGWKSMIAVVGLVLAVRGEAARKRLIGILGGVVIVVTGNLVRITSMVYAVEVLQMDYAFIHTFLWRWGLTFLVFGYWVLWLRWDGDLPDRPKL
ncbi:MAG: exosortase/archaeosortase family protein [Candidatus Nanohaloarchaea archaeon]|nr:exosortase/archaeosortase family protein [Candidatus Nanohaloarchaea archaeon]